MTLKWVDFGMDLNTGGVVEGNGVGFLSELLDLRQI